MKTAKLISLFLCFCLFSCGEKEPHLSVIDIKYFPNEQSFSAGTIKIELIDETQQLYDSLQNKNLKDIIFYAIPNKDYEHFILIDHFEKNGDTIVIGSSTHYFKSHLPNKNLMPDDITDILKTKPIGLVFSSDTLIVDYKKDM